jgi:hypothetical protein
VSKQLGRLCDQMHKKGYRNMGAAKIIPIQDAPMYLIINNSMTNECSLARNITFI